jgi:hypothetical protein
MVPLFVLLVACGGEATETVAPEVPTARPISAVHVIRRDVSSGSVLKVYVPPSPAAPDLALAMQSALANGGFAIVVDRRAGFDFIGRINASVAVVPSMFQVRVNGVQQVKRRYAVTLSLLAAGQLIDQASTQFETDEGVSPGRLQPIVAALNASPKMLEFARERLAVQVATAEAAKKKAEETATTSARVDEETEWNAARPTGCEFPASLTGCDAVRLYLAKYPGGAHVEEANKALAAGQPQLEKLQKDENAWQQAGTTTCRTHTGTEPCVGVELYLAKYQAGLHADEARALLNPSAALPPAPPAPIDPRVRIQECCTALRTRTQAYVTDRSFLFIAAEQCDRVVATGDATALRQRLAGHTMPPACQGL